MGKTILIVEDEQNIVDILSFNLMREGYDTCMQLTAQQYCSWQLRRTRTLLCWT